MRQQHRGLKPVATNKEQIMKSVFRYLLIFALLVGALSTYSYGNQTGVFLFVLLGFVLEAGFWFGLFPIKRRNQR